MRAHSVSTLSTGATLSFSLCVCRGASVTGAVPPPALRAGVGGWGYTCTPDGLVLAGGAQEEALPQLGS